MDQRTLTSVHFIINPHSSNVGWRKRIPPSLNSSDLNPISQLSLPLNLLCSSSPLLTVCLNGFPGTYRSQSFSLIVSYPLPVYIKVFFILFLPLYTLWPEDSNLFLRLKVRTKRLTIESRLKSIRNKTN